MDENNSIQLFEDRKIRTAWDEEQEEWYFSVVDVIAVLTDSSNPTDYLKKMRKRDEQLASYLGTNCPQVTMMGATGKKRKVLAATAEQLLRIIQSIPSPKAEPFKLWLAQVGRERIEETIDPEQAIDRALETYQKKGYDRGRLSVCHLESFLSVWRQLHIDAVRLGKAAPAPLDQPRVLQLGKRGFHGHRASVQRGGDFLNGEHKIDPAALVQPAVCL